MTKIKKKRRLSTKKPAKKCRKPSQVERNKAIASALTKAQNEQNISKMMELLSPNFISHISDMSHPLNREQYIQGVKMAHQAFSNLIFTIEELIGEKDKVTVRIVVRGKHTGVYQGFTPTHAHIEFEGIAIRRIADGKIVEEWQTNDQLSLLRLMGLSVNHII